MLCRVADWLSVRLPNLHMYCGTLYENKRPSVHTKAQAVCSDLYPGCRSLSLLTKRSDGAALKRFWPKMLPFTTSMAL